MSLFCQCFVFDQLSWNILTLYFPSTRIYFSHTVMPPKQRDIGRGENNNALAQETRRKVRRNGKGKPDTAFISKLALGHWVAQFALWFHAISEEPNRLNK
jgi:hypothetical protein